MLTAAIILTIVSLLLFALGIRGRTTARGIFCRRCRFDLAGLTTPQTCPECGRPCDRPRSVLRCRKTSLLAAGLMFLLLSGSAWASRSVAVQSWIMPRLPDRVLVRAYEAGLDAAEPEVLARLNDVMVYHRDLNPLVEHALTTVLSEGHLAAIAEQRILIAALNGAQLSPSQLQRYTEANFKIEMSIREKASRTSMKAFATARYSSGHLGFHQSLLTTVVPAYQGVFEIDTRGHIDESHHFIGADRYEVLSTQCNRIAMRSELGFSQIAVPVQLSETGSTVSMPARIVMPNPRDPDQPASISRLLHRTVELVDEDSLIAPASESSSDNDAFARSVSSSRIEIMPPQATNPHATAMLRIRVLPNRNLSGSFRAALNLPNGTKIWLTDRVSVPAMDSFETMKELMSIHLLSKQDESVLRSVQVADLLLIPDLRATFRDATMPVTVAVGILFEKVPITIRQDSTTVPTPPARDTWRSGQPVPLNQLPPIPADEE